MPPLTGGTCRSCGTLITAGAGSHPQGRNEVEDPEGVDTEHRGDIPPSVCGPLLPAHTESFRSPELREDAGPREPEPYRSRPCRCEDGGGERSPAPCWLRITLMGVGGKYKSRSILIPPGPLTNSNSEIVK